MRRRKFKIMTHHDVIMVIYVIALHNYTCTLYIKLVMTFAMRNITHSYQYQI